MFIDELPILSFGRRLRSGARNVALRADLRATGMVGLSDGDGVPPGTIVRFDIAAGENPAQLLESALTSTHVRAFWFSGADEVACRAATDLGPRPAFWLPRRYSPHATTRWWAWR
jgi:hypothetical protein